MTDNKCSPESEQCVLRNQIEIMGALALLLRYAQPDLVGKAGELDRQRDDLLQRHKATVSTLGNSRFDVAQSAQQPVAWLYEVFYRGAWTQRYSDARPADGNLHRNMRPLYLGVARAALDPAQGPWTRESVLATVLDKGNCGIGDIGPDGKWRRIACDDEKLKGDRHCYFEECDCNKITDGIMALLLPSTDREGK